jgi:hypothetical protein
MKRIGGHIVGTLPVLLALALLLAYGGREVSLRGTVQSTPEQRRAQYVAAVDASVAEQVAALGCDGRTRWSKDAAVRNAAKTRDGSWQFDTTVVRRVPLAEAWASAEAGQAVTVGWCG